VADAGVDGVRPAMDRTATISKPARISMGSRSQVKVLCSVLTCAARSCAVHGIGLALTLVAQQSAADDLDLSRDVYRVEPLLEMFEHRS
jgi:hypothetical protein